MKNKILVVAFLTLVFFIIFNSNNEANTFSSTPPAGRTGAPGHTTCADCHSSSTVGVGAVSILFNGGDNAYTPGSVYDMSVTLNDPDQQRWGFSMVARDGNNNHIGTWQLVDINNTRIYYNNTHIGHKNAPIAPGGSYTFHFQWIAPAQAAGNITFYVGANAANGDYDTDGDHIYTSSLTISEAYTPPVQLKVKLFLEGAYLGGDTMRNEMAQRNQLLYLQPYNGTPWNYAGGETMYPYPADMTDWVLLELYRAADTTLADRRAAILLRNGTVQDTNGMASVTFANTTAGSYFVAVRHRNHLAVLSRNPIALPNATTYDFTQNPDAAMGNNQLALIDTAAARYGLQAGDFTANGQISIEDFYWYVLYATSPGVYYAGDCSIDAAVTVRDYNYFAKNINAAAVPIVKY